MKNPWGSDWIICGKTRYLQTVCSQPRTRLSPDRGSPNCAHPHKPFQSAFYTKYLPARRWNPHATALIQISKNIALQELCI